MSTNPTSPRIKEIREAYRDVIQSPRSLVIRAIDGVDIQAVQDMMFVSGQKKEKVAELLQVSPRTLSNYEREQKKLSASQSESVLKLISLHLEGRLVFGGSESFNTWLGKPSYGLQGKVPADLLLTSGGISLVHEEVLRIAYGDLA